MKIDTDQSLTSSLLQNLYVFMKERIAITVQKNAEKKEKNDAPPLLAPAFLANITHPFASAKSAIDQRAKKTNTMA